MSHELRTPLNAIIGFAALLGEELGGPLAHEQRRNLGRIESTAGQLLGLIEQLPCLAPTPRADSREPGWASP